MKALILFSLFTSLAYAFDEAQLQSEVNGLSQDLDTKHSGKFEMEPEKKKGLFKSLRNSRKEYKKTLSEDPGARDSADRMKKFQQALIKDKVLQERVAKILNDCSANNVRCDEELEKVIAETVGGLTPAGTMRGSMKGTFGICSADQSEKSFHAVVFGKRRYNCKLSTEGVVYDRALSRKTYGPGLYTTKHSVLIACSGNAFGKRNAGFSFGAGLYYGLALSSSVGGGGLCLYVGVGKSLGAYAGIDVLNFEAI